MLADVGDLEPLQMPALGQQETCVETTPNQSIKPGSGTMASAIVARSGFVTFTHQQEARANIAIEDPICFSPYLYTARNLIERLLAVERVQSSRDNQQTVKSPSGAGALDGRVSTIG